MTTADAAGGDAVALECGESGVSGFWRDGKEQAAGGLRIEEQVLIFGRDARIESCAIANESAVIFQSAGEMAFAGGFHRAGKIGEGGVIDFEGNGFDAVRGIAERHFARVAEQAEAGNVGDGVNAASRRRLFIDFLESSGGIAIEGGHGSDGSGERFRGGLIFFQTRW